MEGSKMDNKKKILIINAHTYEKSFCNSLAESYFKGAQERGFDVKITNLRDLKFDPILHSGYSEIMPLEDDLKTQQELIKNCDHLVIVTPLWWCGMPALLKGFTDRLFLPGYAFKYMENSPLPKKLLTGKSASVIYTQGSPHFYSLLVLHDAFWNTMKKGLLEFCGFSPVKRIVIDNMSTRKEKDLKNQLNKIYKKGKEGF